MARPAGGKKRENVESNKQQRRVNMLVWWYWRIKLLEQLRERAQLGETE